MPFIPCTTIPEAKEWRGGCGRCKHRPSGVAMFTSPFPARFGGVLMAADLTPAIRLRLGSRFAPCFRAASTGKATGDCFEMREAPPTNLTAPAIPAHFGAIPACGDVGRSSSSGNNEENDMMSRFLYGGITAVGGKTRLCDIKPDGGNHIHGGWLP